MAVSIRVRRGTTAQWNASTNVLASGEIGLDTTLGKIKVGNGSSLWQSLPFFSVAPSELLSLTQEYIADTVLDGTGIDKGFNAQTGKLTVSVDNTIANKTYVDTAVSSLGNTAAETYIPLSLYGNPEGVATLDENGTIPDSEIPATITRDTELSSAISTEVTNRNTAISTAISNLLDSAPSALDTLNELAAALADDPNFATTLTTTVGNKLDSSLAATTYAPIDSPIFTGTVSGVTKTHVGLGNVDNTSDAEKPISTLVQTALETKINEIISFNTQSGSYTLQSTDIGKLIEMSGGGTLTIPSDTTYNFPIGTSIEILQTGTSQVTIAGAGFTPNSTPGLKLRTQWSSASLLKRGSNSWVVLGDLAV
jgi:hypothetical protein